MPALNITEHSDDWSRVVVTHDGGAKVVFDLTTEYVDASIFSVTGDEIDRDTMMEMEDEVPREAPLFRVLSLQDSRVVLTLVNGDTFDAVATAEGITVYGFDKDEIQLLRASASYDVLGYPEDGPSLA